MIAPPYPALIGVLIASPLVTKQRAQQADILALERFQIWQLMRFAVGINKVAVAYCQAYEEL